MSEPSAYERLEAILREILAKRATGASAAAVEAMTEAAGEIWAEVPPDPPGTKREWPPDIVALADELGFTAEIEAKPIDADSEQSVADASRLAQLEAQIDAAIVEAGGVGNLVVACTPHRIVLTGIAADEEARDQALLVAAKLAPGLEIEDAIDVA